MIFDDTSFDVFNLAPTVNVGLDHVNVFNDTDGATTVVGGGVSAAFKGAPTVVVATLANTTPQNNIRRFFIHEPATTNSPSGQRHF